MSSYEDTNIVYYHNVKTLYQTMPIFDNTLYSNISPTFFISVVSNILPSRKQHSHLGVYHTTIVCVCVSECRIIVDPIYPDLWTFVDIINTPPRWKNAEFEHRSVKQKLFKERQKSFIIYQSYWLCQIRTD